MKTFEHKGDTLAVIDGDVWLKLTSSSAAVSTPLDVPMRRKRGRRPGNTGPRPDSMTQAQKQIREYKPRRRLGPEAEEVVKTDIRSGMSLTEACRKYEIAVSTYYRLKNELENGPVREELKLTR